MTVWEKMKSGMLYCCDDEDLMQEQTKCLEKLYDFNQTRPGEADKRAALLKELANLPLVDTMHHVLKA